LNALLYNSTVAKGKPESAVKNSYQDADPGQAFDFRSIPETSETDANVLESIYKITRITALIHDLGHGPFSHHFDQFSPPLQIVREHLAECDFITFSSQLFDDVEDSGDQNESRIEHEQMSAILFAKIWNDLISRDKVEPENFEFGDDDVPTVVAATLFNSPQFLSEGNQLKKYIPLISNIISSAPADADRMDYLRRDSESIGVSYGFYDKEKLLKSFLPYVTQNEEEGKKISLGIKKSGIAAVENFIQARYELFKQIYQHKTNSAIQAMLNQITLIAKGSDSQVLDWSETDDIHQIFEAYQELTDEHFLRILRGYFSDESSLPKIPISENISLDIERIATNIYRRKLWKRIDERNEEEIEQSKDRLIESSEQLELSDHELSIELSDLEGHLEIWEAHPQATKGLENGLSLLTRADSV
jgi:HD superfamily phosphohydrolase